MSSNKWAKNVILVDAVFLDKMGYIFRSNYERLLKRDVNKADLAIWLESAMLDGGLRVGDNTVQVVVLFDENAEGFDNFLNKQKTEAIAALGANPDIKTVAKILDRRIRSEKIAWKDIKMRTFIAEGNSRNDLAAHVYDITYGSVEAGKDNLVVIDDSIVRGTTLRESIIRILDRLHPKRIVVVSSSPQVRFPDYYGIDMSHMDEFIAFKAAIALTLEQGGETRLKDIYRRCKEQENLPKEQIKNFVKEVYAPFSDDDISKKMAELLRPNGVTTEIHIVYQLSLIHI